MAIESKVAYRRLHDGSRGVEQDNIIRMIWGDITRMECTKRRDAKACSSIIIYFSICGFHGDGARGRLCVNAD